MARELDIPDADAANPVNVADYEGLAEAALDPGAFGYFAGGAGDELTLRENVAAFERWQIRPRMLVDVDACSTAATVMGRELSMPVIVAPTAFHRLAHPDGEEATARAAAAAGTVMCLSTLATATPTSVAEAAPSAPRWFQVYCLRDDGVTRALVDEAVAAGYEALVLTVDAPVAGRRERDVRTGFTVPPGAAPSLTAAAGHTEPMDIFEIFSLVDPTLTWRDLERVASLSDLPLLVKGVMTAEDTRLACEHGADGVVVSNHGGRQLDGVPATIDVLAEVVEAAEERLEVLVDGGVRRGGDVLKALALGASAVLVGRPVVWGLAAGGEEGARAVLEILRDELQLALKLAGCPSADHVTRAHVQPAPR